MEANSDIIPKFCRFLKDENAYDKYTFNMSHTAMCQSHPLYKILKKIKETNDVNSTLIRQFFNRLSPYSWIMEAFVWRKTEEGSLYWSNLNSKWKNLLDDDWHKEHMIENSTSYFYDYYDTRI